MATFLTQGETDKLQHIPNLAHQSTVSVLRVKNLKQKISSKPRPISLLLFFLWVTVSHPRQRLQCLQTCWAQNDLGYSFIKTINSYLLHSALQQTPTKTSCVNTGSLSLMSRTLILSSIGFSSFFPFHPKRSQLAGIMTYIIEGI